MNGIRGARSYIVIYLQCIGHWCSCQAGLTHPPLVAGGTLQQNILCFSFTAITASALDFLYYKYVRVRRLNEASTEIHLQLCVSQLVLLLVFLRLFIGANVHN